MTNAKSSRETNNKRRRQSRGSINPADWASINPDIIQRAIATVGRSGGAIRFGYTRDGGSYAIGILGDGDPYTEYLRPTDDVEAYFEQLIEDWAEGAPS